MKLKVFGIDIDLWVSFYIKLSMVIQIHLWKLCIGGCYRQMININIDTN